MAGNKESDSSVPPQGFFCIGCNIRFLTEDEGACPRCGVTADAGSTVAAMPTQLFKSGPLADLAARAPDLEVLQRLIGRDLHVYACRALLGRGGMGWVYLAEHRDLGRQCALKILSPQLAERDQEYLHNFRNEGRAAASLVHPHIVTTHAIGEADGLHFLEMEFVRGRSLQDQIDQGPLTPLRATSIICQIAEGLAAAHQAGILHRDLKPDNVLLTHRGVAKIGDFGLAKRLLSDSGSRIQDTLAGTPQFMAPELFHGEPASQASDVYSLGVCFFLLLTGRLPFARPHLKDLINAAMHEPFPSVHPACPDATLEMVECLSRLTAKSPANRPQSGLEACHLLQAVLGHLRDIETLIHDAFDGLSAVQWTRTRDRFQLQVTLPDGRGQTVYIEDSDHHAEGRLLTIFSTCCPAHPSYYEPALRLNAHVSHGGIAIRDLNGQSYFVMVDTYPRATIDTEEIRKSVLEVARQADRVERELTGIDIH
ncbi:MAG: serine/threonine-protein kinase [Planctomycetaceae bacterium]